VRPGDALVWGQGAGEPLTLVEALVEQRVALGPLRVFLGASYSGVLKPEHRDFLAMTGIGGVATNAPLARSGALDVIPCHVSAIPALISSRRIPVDVVLLQVSPPGPDGYHSLGLAADWLRSAMAVARVVIAEVNDRVPATRGETRVSTDELDVVIRTSREPVTVATGPIDPTEQELGERVAALIPDRATVQLGVGSITPAVAQALRAKRELGLHCGTIGDWFVGLNESGALTNRHKGRDEGVSVTASIVGSRDLYDYVADNPAIELRPVSYTHGPRVLASLSALVEIKSAAEVDLTGQVNAETISGRHIGAVGGQVDFVRHAILGGRSLIALPSAAKQGERSRIVARLADGIVTTARSDADLIVTEHGVADLRGVPLEERRRRMIAVADPAFQPWLVEQLASGTAC
jgi:acetyl-CoA hydrolase